jgi:hypothetical protein
MKTAIAPEERTRREAIIFISRVTVPLLGVTITLE